MIQTFNSGLFQKEQQFCFFQTPDVSKQLEAVDKTAESAESHIDSESLDKDVKQVLETLRRKFDSIIPTSLTTLTHNSLFDGTEVANGNVFTKQFRDLYEVTASSFHASGDTARQELDRLTRQEQILTGAITQLTKEKDRAEQRKEKVLKLRRQTRRHKSIFNPTRITDKMGEGVENYFFDRAEISGTQSKIDRLTSEKTKTTARITSVTESITNAFKKHLASRDTIVDIFTDADIPKTTGEILVSEIAAQHISRTYPLEILTRVDDETLATQLSDAVEKANVLLESMSFDERSIFLDSFKRFFRRKGSEAIQFENKQADKARFERQRAIREARKQWKAGRVESLKNIRIGSGMINEKLEDGEFTVLVNTGSVITLLRTDDKAKANEKDIIIFDINTGKYEYGKPSEVKDNAELKKHIYSKAEEMRTEIMKSIKGLEEQMTNPQVNLNDRARNFLTGKIKEKLETLKTYTQSFQIKLPSNSKYNKALHDFTELSK